MKRLKLWLFGALALGGIAAVVHATTVVYSQKFVDNPGVAYTQNFDLDLKTAGKNGVNIDNLTMQTVYSSATIPSVQFTDGSLASGTLTVTSTSGLVGVQAAAQITVDSTATLKNATITVNGKQLRAKYDWFPKSTTALTATDIARVVTLLAGIDASAASNVVYATATAAGTAGNSFTLAKFGAGLSVSGATFSGGVDDAYVEIGGYRLTRGTHWEVGASTAATAGNIADAVRAHSVLNGLVTVSTSAAAVITITAREVGTAGNLALVGFPASIEESGPLMTGGTNKAWDLNSATIRKTSHGLTSALPVLYSTGVVAISGLIDQTTYYAIPLTADTFQLAATSTGAIAGVGIPLASTSTTGPHTYTLAPLAPSGTFSWKWQYSNDGNTFFDVDTSSVTFGTPYTAGSQFTDFGATNFRYLRLKYTNGTAGAVDLDVTGYGTNNN